MEELTLLESKLLREKETDELLTLLGKYLQMKSLDGKFERQSLRKEMKTYLTKIKNSP